MDFWTTSQLSSLQLFFFSVLVLFTGSRQWSLIISITFHNLWHVWHFPYTFISFYLRLVYYYNGYGNSCSSKSIYYVLICSPYSAFRHVILALFTLSCQTTKVALYFPIISEKNKPTEFFTSAYQRWKSSQTWIPFLHQHHLTHPLCIYLSWTFLWCTL